MPKALKAKVFKATASVQAKGFGLKQPQALLWFFSRLYYSRKSRRLEARAPKTRYTLMHRASRSSRVPRNTFMSM